jgi:hypothetical protein
LFIYVANFHTANTSSNLQYVLSITVYLAGSDGDVPPIGGIGGPFRGLDPFGPTGIAVGPSGQ